MSQFITDVEAIKWGREKAAEIVEGPYFFDGLKLGCLVDLCERQAAEIESLNQRATFLQRLERSVPLKTEAED